MDFDQCDFLIKVIVPAGLDSKLGFVKEILVKKSSNIQT